jgi:hypothetical protein
MKRQWLLGGMSAIAGLLLSTTTAGAVPTPDRNGDYTQSNATGHLEWRVVDPDSKGLNCRMAKRFQNTDYASMEAPDELYQDFVHSIGEWSVVTTFPTDELLQVQTTHRTNPIFRIDRQGKSWMAVSTKKRGPYMCFVRSNRYFIRPI